MANPCCCPISYLPAALPHLKPHGTAMVCAKDWRTNLCGFMKVGDMCVGKATLCVVDLLWVFPSFPPPYWKKWHVTFMPYYWQKAWVAEGGRRCEQGVLHLQPNATLRQDETGIENCFHYVNLGVCFLEPQVGLRHGTSEKSGIPHLRENLSISST